MSTIIALLGVPEMREIIREKLKFVHSELVIALIAFEFLFSWIARNYFKLAFGPTFGASSINCLPGHNS
jgi:hypothetical protein